MTDLKFRVYKRQDIPQIIELVKEGNGSVTNRLDYVLRHNVNVNSNFQCWVFVINEEEVVGVFIVFSIQSAFSDGFYVYDSFYYHDPEFNVKSLHKDLIEAYKKWASAKNVSIREETNILERKLVEGV